MIKHRYCLKTCAKNNKNMSQLKQVSKAFINPSPLRLNITQDTIIVLVEYAEPDGHSYSSTVLNQGQINLPVTWLRPEFLD